MGSILKPSVPDNSAQIAELNKQEAAAEKSARDEKARLNRELLSMRQRRFGRQSLIRNSGGELGVSSLLGSTNSQGGDS